MTPVLPPLEFAPGRVFCLHIPHGSCETGGALESEIRQIAAGQGKRVAIAQPAGFQVPVGKTETCAGWLGRMGGISEPQARRIIGGLGVAMAERLAHNPGTPRSLLGITAALIGRPDVLTYSTTALDPDGCRTVHRHVAARCSRLCVLHLSHPSVFGDGTPHLRICALNAQCMELSGWT